MPYDEVRAVLYEAYKKDPEDVFASIVKVPTGLLRLRRFMKPFLKVVSMWFSRFKGAAFMAPWKEMLP